MSLCSRESGLKETSSVFFLPNYIDYHRNPRIPSFLGVVTHILGGPKTFIFPCVVGVQETHGGFSKQPRHNPSPACIGAASWQGHAESSPVVSGGQYLQGQWPTMNIPYFSRKNNV